MTKLALVSLVFLQIQVSSQALAEGRLLRGGIFVEEAAARQQTIPPEQWEARKFVRYIGQVEYSLTGQTAVPAKGAPARAPKPLHNPSRKPPHPSRR